MGYPEAFIVIRDGNDMICEAPISHEVLAFAVAATEDVADNFNYFKLMARHPSSLVREEVATKDCLDQHTVSLLVKDKSIDVVRSVVATQGFAQYATTDDLVTAIDRDTALAIAIVDKVNQLENADTTAVWQKLADVGGVGGTVDVGDTALLIELGNNHDTPSELLEQLASHPDP